VESAVLRWEVFLDFRFTETNSLLGDA
jgi:hypothetical protein